MGGKCPVCKSTELHLLRYKCNYSYFQAPKGQWHPSEYSLVQCKNCSHSWKTKSSYVDTLQMKEGR